MKYISFGANFALAIGIDELWQYYTVGNSDIDLLLKYNIFTASSEIEKKYKIKWKDLVDAID